MDPAPLHSTAVPASWRLVRHRERVAGEAFTLDVLPSFERASAEMYPQLGHVRDARLRDDLSPMFGTLWASSRVLIAKVAALDSLAGARVLELGCGLALPSMVAARRGAHVVATDLHPDAGPLLTRNLALNRLTGHVRYEALDWRTPGPLAGGANGFDRVWASDVLFSRELPELVATMFARYLGPDGVGWLTDPGRAWLPELVPAAEQLGLSAQVDVEDDGDSTEAFVVTFRRMS